MMKKYAWLPILLCLLLLGCLTNKEATSKTNETFETRLDSLNMFDSARHRLIPVALYLPKAGHKIKNQPVVIVSHGYFDNRGGSNREYSYLTEFLASKGYFVASIQHELPTDDLIPAKGVPQVVRRPFWERGAKNILFVINELKKKNPELDYKHVTLIGHSNGGDMSMLFGQEYPALADKIISLDNKRMAFLGQNTQKYIHSVRATRLQMKVFYLHPKSNKNMV